MNNNPFPLSIKIIIVDNVSREEIVLTFSVFRLTWLVRFVKKHSLIS